MTGPDDLSGGGGHITDEPRAWKYYAVALAASLLPACLAVILVWQVRSAGYEAAGKSELFTASVLASEFENSFGQFDALLKSIGRQYVEGVEDGTDETSRLARVLNEELADLPFASRIFVADASGAFVVGGGAAFKYKAAGANVSDRRYFARSSAGDADLIFEGPHRAKFGDEWVLVLARRLQDSKGAFLGVVAGSIPVEYFERRLNQVEHDPRNVIVFRNAEGARIAEHSHTPAVSGAPGDATISPALQAILRASANEALFRAESPLDHVERLMAYEKLGAAPFFILVGQATAELDRPWRLLAAELGLLGLLVTGAALWSARRLHASALSLCREKALLEQRVADRTRDLEAGAQTLSAVLRSVVTRQEADRQRIARELHDRLGQYLAAMTLKLGVLEPVAGEPAALKAGLADLKRLTATVGQEASRIAWELRPIALDDIGLESAVQNLVEEWARRSGLRFDLHLALKDRRLPPEVETTLYRVLQESVTNVVKHACAKAVGVTLTTSPNDVVMTVEDDGIGFDLEEVARTSRRLGLLGMRERLAAVAGNLAIETRPDGGTTLVIRIPLPTAAAAA